MPVVTRPVYSPRSDSYLVSDMPVVKEDTDLLAPSLTVFTLDEEAWSKAPT